MGIWGDDDSNGDGLGDREPERRRGTSSLIKLEEDALEKLGHMSDQLIAIRGRMRELSRAVARLEKVVYGFCALIIVGFVGVLVQTFIHK